jgi:ubiquinone biosynthesis protein
MPSANPSVGAAPVPPLPDRRALVRASTHLAGMPGLTDAALQWLADAPMRRRAIDQDARSVATPRVWHDTIASLATTGWKMAATAGPEAPMAVLRMAATAFGLPPVEGPAASAETLKRAQRAVRAGGPAYIKLGQFIASASGLLPDEWVEAFAWCRDEAPPLREGVAQKVIDRELREDRGRLAELDPQPLACGSIGQVHRGRLDDGTEVVVKVRRPRLRKRLRSDIESLALVAAAAQRLHPAASAANLSGFVELFAQLTLEELDFRLEAANLVESDAVLEALGAGHIRVPRPIPGMVTERLLVMEYVPGVSYARLPAALVEEVDGDQLLHLAIKSVLEATLVHGLFHGDLHAGNVLIDQSGGFSLVDFGIVGRLDAAQRAGLVRFLFGFATSDAEVQVKAMQTFGAIGPDASLEKIIAELQVESDRLAARTDGAVTFEQLGDTLGRLLTVMARNGFTMPKELVLFFKNLLYLSGFAASVAPDADLLAVVEEILMDLFARDDGALAALIPQS